MKVTIIADASYCPEHKVAGYGYWIASNRGKKPGQGEFKNLISGNVAAEMMALCNALHDALIAELVQRGDEILFQSDCIPAMDAFQRGVSTSEDETQAIAVMNKLLEQFDLIADWRHVKGHSGRKEARFVTDTACDQRARRAMRKARASKICKDLIEHINNREKV